MKKRTQPDRAERCPSRRVLPLLGILACVVWCVGAEASDWKPFGLQGVNVTSIAAAADRLCAGTVNAGVYCLDLSSAGTEWVPLGLEGEVIEDLWIDSSNPQVMFAALGYGVASPRLYRTLDGGANWEAADEGTTGSLYAVHGVPGSLMVFASGYHVYRSMDHGESWSTLIEGGSLMGYDILEVAPTDATTVWSGAQTPFFGGLIGISRDSGTTWQLVWGSDYDAVEDISAHPTIDGLALMALDRSVLRTEDHGGSLEEVLIAGYTWLHLDWDGGNPERCYAAGRSQPESDNAFISRDLGETWSTITGRLASVPVEDLVADYDRLGVAYAATNDGVYRFFGGGLTLCLDSRDGLDRIRLGTGDCEGIPPATPSGDVVMGHLAALGFDGSGVDLGEVECLARRVSVALIELDPPEPAPGDGLFLLVREEGEPDYGLGGSSPERHPSLGDCPM